MANLSLVSEHAQECSQEADIINYRHLAIGLLSARVYSETTAELISECAVLDFDRDGVALILPEDCVKPEQNIRVSLARKHHGRDLDDDVAISFVPGNIRYVQEVVSGVRAGVKLEYAGRPDIEDACRARVIKIENYLRRHQADAQRAAATAAALPKHYQFGGRTKFAI
ncbi:MAG: hypothetical protein JJ867_13390 [Marinobacter sp.]|nr:hypothetical protein [Marinobacter sp.]